VKRTGGPSPSARRVRHQPDGFGYNWSAVSTSRRRRCSQTRSRCVVRLLDRAGPAWDVNRPPGEAKAAGGRV